MNLFSTTICSTLVEIGVIEIKSVIPSVQYKRIKSGVYDSAYRWQIIFNLLETKREWLDYISFCQDFTEDKRLFVQRIFASELEDDFLKIAKRVNEFGSLVEEVIRDIAA